jgi:hypothetical protein
MQARHPFATLWSFHLQTDDRRWCVFGRFATVPLAASNLYLADLALDPTLTYLAFDFWTQTFLGPVQGRIPCRDLPLGHCQVVSLVAASDHPQLIGSSRHISMDAVSVTRHRWIPGQKELELAFATVPKTRETYWVHVPQGWVWAGVEGSGAEFSVHAGPVLTGISLVAEGKTAAVRLRFRG